MRFLIRVTRNDNSVSNQTVQRKIIIRQSYQLSQDELGYSFNLFDCSGLSGRRGTPQRSEFESGILKYLVKFSF